MSENQKCPFCRAEISQESLVAICPTCQVSYHAECAKAYDYKCVICHSRNLIVQPQKTNFVVTGTNAQDVKSVTDSILHSINNTKIMENSLSTIKVLFLAANPIGTNQLRLDKECRAISEKLSKSEFRDKIELKQEWAVRVSDLQGHLLRYKPSIVHFSGHGSNESEIILEDDFGKKHLLSASALSRLFSMFKSELKCVVLNACYSEQQALAIAQHIASVIGMSKSITDTAAISFASAFYQALGFGRDIKSAFDMGCIQIDLENLEEQDTPKLIALHESPENIVLVSSSQIKTLEKESPIKVINSEQTTIRVNVIILNEGRVFTVELPVDILVKFAIHRFIEQLKLPQTFENGWPVKYNLYSKTQGRKLEDDLTFRQNKVQNDETLGLNIDFFAG